MKSSENTRQRILKAAEDEFSEKGLYGSRADAIAARSGVNKKQIYEYFGKKEELYMHVLKEVYNRPNRLEEALILNGGCEPEDMIRKLVAFYFRFLHDNPHYVKLLLWENLNEAYYLKQAGCVGERHFEFDALKKYFETARKEGRLSDRVDTEELVISINMFCFSYYSNIYSMSCLLDRNLWTDDEISRRTEFVADILCAYVRIDSTL